ncbi:MAG TPA: hypothetical protein VMX17_06295 [Candidatus Glassbacteria bacterium]|nr:hypothetical protein [Candidatus Glassbacteria bacterium]
MLEIINQKNMNFLFEVAKKPRNISELAKLGDVSLSAASVLISRWDRVNLVKKTKYDGHNGKEIIITLTDYGIVQVRLLKELRKNYKINKEQIEKILEQEKEDEIKITEKGGEQCKTQ